MRFKNNDIATLTLTFGVGIILILMSMLTSCSHKVRYVTQTVEIPKIQKEYVNRVDSIFIKDVDSVFVDRYLKSDTQYIETTKIKYRNRYALHTDTILKTDSIFVPVRYDNPDLIREIEKLKTDSAVKEKIYNHSIKVHRYVILIFVLCLILFNLNKIKKIFKFLIDLIRKVI